MKKYISFFLNAFIAGIFLSVGCTVNLSSDSRLAGAFLFSLGLFAIITFKLSLFTGKAGYIVSNPPVYILEVLVTFLGNAAGALCSGLALGLSKAGPQLYEKSAEVFSKKAGDSFLSIFVLALFCGILMYTAVEGNRIHSEKGNFTGALFITVMPVAVFITAGFNHSVADTAYFFLGGAKSFSLYIKYIVPAFFGNALGCCVIPLIKKRVC